MGQSWWWVVLAVVVVALLVAVARVLGGRGRAAVPAANAEVATAADGSAGVAGSGAVAPARDEEGPPQPTADAPGGAVARIPAPREEPRLSPPREAADQRPPDPAGSALAALDSGLVGPASTFTAAAAAVSAATARRGPYPGSLLPAADGTNPTPDHRVKAHEGSRRYHTPDSPFYQRTRGDVWFRTAEEAGAAGFTAWHAP